MKLSILDQSPISSNQTAKEALTESMKLAQAGEKLGYYRYWIAEHHDLPGLACSAPEVLLSYIGAHTNREYVLVLERFYCLIISRIKWQKFLIH